MKPAEYPTACCRDESGQPGGLIELTHGSQSKCACGLWPEIPFRLDTEIPERGSDWRGSEGDERNTWSNSRSIWYGNRYTGSDGRPCACISNIATTLLTSPGDADTEKRVCEGVVCTFPLAKAEAMGRGTVGRRILCPLSRWPSNSRNHKTIHKVPKKFQKYTARIVGRKFLKAPQLAAG